MAKARMWGDPEYQHLRAAIQEFYPDANAIPRLRDRIEAINANVLAGQQTMNPASLARLRFLNERLEELEARN